MKITNQWEAPDIWKVNEHKGVNADGTECLIREHMIREHPLDIYINEVLVMRLVCTPQDLFELTVGRLMTEGYIRNIDDIEQIYLCNLGTRIRVFLKNPLTLDTEMETEPTCCTGNQVLMRRKDGAGLKPLSAADWSSDWIFKLAERFSEGSRIHKETKGTHSCYLSVKGEIVFMAEDIGRHNAVDKAVGYAVMHDYPLKDCILFTTGRVPTDMVKKCITAGVPVLVSKAVPTDAAVEMAEQYHMTLICKAWPDRFEIFHDGRISI